VTELIDQPPLHKLVGVGIIWDGDLLLIDRRRPTGLLGGFWEFPGGKVEPGESIPECIAREIQEELALQVTVGAELITIKHTYSEFDVTLVVHHCQYLGGDPQPLSCDEILWVKVAELDNYQFPAANAEIIAALTEVKN
jgi:A/G-specific adenine glycosylase